MSVPILTKVGHAWEFLDTFRYQINVFPLVNGTVLRLYLDNVKEYKKSKSDSTRVILDTCLKNNPSLTLDNVRKQIERKEKLFRKLIQKLPRNSQKVLNLLNERFLYQPNISDPGPSASTVQPSKTTTLDTTEASASSLSKSTTSAIDSSSTSTPPTISSTSSGFQPLPTPHPPVLAESTIEAIRSPASSCDRSKRSSSCKYCDDLKDRYTRDVGRLKLSLSAYKQKIKSLCLVYEVKRVNQAKKRDREQIRKLREQLREAKSELRLQKRPEEKCTLDSKERLVLKSKVTRTKNTLKKTRSTIKKVQKKDKEVI